MESWKIKREITISEILIIIVMSIALFIQHKSYEVQEKELNTKIEDIQNVVKKMKEEEIARVENNVESIKSDANILQLFNENSRLNTSIQTDSKIAINGFLSELTFTTFLLADEIKKIHTDKNTNILMIQKKLALLNDYLEITQKYYQDISSIGQNYRKKLEEIELLDNKAKQLHLIEAAQNEMSKKLQEANTKQELALKEFSSKHSEHSELLLKYLKK